MTGIDGWKAGSEIACPECEFVESNAYGEPVCVLASEFFLSGETMTANACPRSIQEQAA